MKKSLFIRLKKIVFFSSIATILFFTLSCSQITIYTKPSIDTREDWRTKLNTNKAQAEKRWWQGFQDPILDNLINEGLQNNLDILLVSLRVQEYRGKYMSTSGPLYPQVDIDVSALRNQITDHGQKTIGDSYNININISWEIDFWGKIKGMEESAMAQLLNTEEAKQAVLLTIVISITDTYMTLLSLDEQLRIARDTTKSRKEYYDIFQLRFQGGVISELELNQARSEYESARANIPNLHRQITQKENELSLLIGANPKSIKRSKSLHTINTPSIPAGLPSELIQRRPDIRQAEKDLISANALIGVARAFFFSKYISYRDVWLGKQ